MYTIASEQSSAWCWDVAANVGEEVVCGAGGGSGRGAHRVGEARASVSVDAPLRHVVEDGAGNVNDSFESIRLEELELCVCNEAADLEDPVGFRIETRHLWELACRISTRSRRTSQSIQTRGSVEGSSGMLERDEIHGVLG